MSSFLKTTSKAFILNILVLLVANILCSFNFAHAKTESDGLKQGVAKLSGVRKLNRKKKVEIKAAFSVTTKSNTSLQIDFSMPVNLDLEKTSTYKIFPPLEIISATSNYNNTSVYLQTASQEGKEYSIFINPKSVKTVQKKRKGKKIKVTVKGATIKSFPLAFNGVPVFVPAPDPIVPPKDTTKPFVTGAISRGNNLVLVGFSEAMSESAIKPDAYQIVQEVVNPEVGNLRVVSARFADDKHFAVELTTASQNEVTYKVTAVNVFDEAGNPLETKRTGLGELAEPSSALFAGTPPSGDALVDTDGDFLSDNDELRGWEVTILLQNGKGVVRQVTSDPYIADTDNDGHPDGLEKTLVTDPRDADTDDDDLTDYQEFNETYSEPTRQDTDEDGLFDGLEFNFFKTSPIFEDTDGDRLEDGDEVITANRNARVADLPLPGIEIGDADLRLDVRFTASSAQGSRVLETKSSSSTLQQSDTKTFTETDSASHEFATKVAVEQGWVVGVPEAAAKGKFSFEAGYTGQWQSSYTEESSKSTQKEVAKSFSTDQEKTAEESLTREIVGASMKVAVMVHNKGNLAFNLKNLQLVAFAQDPKKPGRYLPIATLNPDVNTPDTLSMGPLVSTRGPFIFESEQIFPSVVESLMLDPRGLLFKVSNYDIEDEIERNFAFTSQDINDRTAPLIIDFGGADIDNDGIGDGTERYRVATSSGQAIDTNEDGIVDDTDRRVTFDPDGKQVGIKLSEAMESILGLTYYKEEETPSSSLSDFELENSFSTKLVLGVEKVWRVRRVSRDITNPLNQWIVFTNEGILGQDASFDSLVLSPESGITLKFAQDLDGDRLLAATEFSLSCSDTKIDSDGDTLSDYAEVVEGWNVNVVGFGSFKSFSSCAREDTDQDGISDLDESARVADVDLDGDMIPDLFNVPAALDARSPDTDRDGLTDFEEINGFTVMLRFPEDTNNDTIPDLFEVTVMTDPLNPDTDSDSVLDGDEKKFGINPLKPDGAKVFDDDGDGLRNFEETTGYQITYKQVGVFPNQEGLEAICSATDGALCGNQLVTSDTNKSDTDGDGLTDRQERIIGTHPRLSDTDDDGLTDFQEVDVVVLGGVETITNITDPRDADTDNDLRSDGDEVNIPWIVSVVGEANRQVFSDPLISDLDLDNLVDGEELALGTDPASFDTDADGISDTIESGASRGTNPLQKDQKVRFAFTNIKVTGDCEPAINGDGEFMGTLSVQHSPNDSSATQLYEIFGNISGVQGTDYPLTSASKTYVLKDGDTVTMKSSTLCEEDDTGSPGNDCNAGDETLTDFTEAFPYEVSNQTKVVSASESGSGPDCQLDFTLVTTVITN